MKTNTKTRPNSKSSDEDKSVTVTPNKPETGQPTATLPIPETNQEFNWKNCWYPITFVQDLPKDRPYSFSLYDEPLVLFRNQDSQLACLTDRCPHRAAKLSDGQIIDGKIECLYHGWQFGVDGQCLHIPQLPADAKIPVNACVQSFAVVERQGIVWIWPGEPEAADKALIPTVAELDKPEFAVGGTDFMYDLPYDQTYFIEQVIDPAHVPISHDGTLAEREDAQPLEMEAIESSAQGIRGRYRQTREPNSTWTQLDFVAPNLITYRFDPGKPGLSAGFVLYSMPLGNGRCRLLARKYRNFSTWTLKLKPRWLEHMLESRNTEEDLALIVGQQEYVKKSRQSLQELYLPLKTSDLLVMEYRKWLDWFGSSLPFYQGYSTSKPLREEQENNQQPAPASLDRFKRHTQICSSCNRAYWLTIRLKQMLVGMAIALAAFAIVTDGSWIQILGVSASLSAAALAVVAEKVKTKFERSYTRH